MEHTRSKRNSGAHKSTDNIGKVLIFLRTIGRFNIIPNIMPRVFFTE